MKIAKEMNTTIIEMEGSILKASNHNWIINTTNTTNIISISEDLWNLVQSDIENWVYQIQQMLADKLDNYKGKGNKYVDNNIKKIQDYSNHMRNQHNWTPQNQVLSKTKLIIWKNIWSLYNHW